MAEFAGACNVFDPRVKCVEGFVIPLSNPSEKVSLLTEREMMIMTDDYDNNDKREVKLADQNA